MRSFSAWRAAIRARLAGSSLEDWASFLESCPGGTMRHLFRASLLERIALSLRTPRGLAALCICWLLLILALVFGFTLLISWPMPPSDFVRNSTAASPSESDSGGWAARRLYCSPHRPCDAWSPFSEDAPFNLRLEIQHEVPLWVS